MRNTLTLGDWFIHGKFLIMPASPETARLAAFQIMQWPLKGGLPTILFEQLLKRVRTYGQTDGSYGAILNRIREFYFYWSGVMPQGAAQAVVERLERDTQNGALAVFYLEDDPRFTLIRERSGPAVLPRGDDVAGWSVKQRILAMLEAVPGAAAKAFKPTVAAELRAFFSLRNLEIVATIFVLVVAVQAVPLADGVVDIALFSLALAQFGWSGVLTLRDLIAAVVMAARAKDRATIDAAAAKAAEALVALGVTALLAAVVKRFSEGSLAPKDEDVVSPVRGANDSLLSNQRQSLSSVTDSDPPSLSSPTGRSGFPLEVPRGTNEPTTIGNTYFTGHALDEMQSDGITPSSVFDTIQNGNSYSGRYPGTLRFFSSSNNMTVITNNSGAIVTVYRGGVDR